MKVEKQVASPAKKRKKARNMTTIRHERKESPVAVSGVPWLIKGNERKDIWNNRSNSLLVEEVENRSSKAKNSP